MSVRILKYFTLKRRSSLPNPDGPLSKVVPSEGIHYLQTRYWKRKIIATCQVVMQAEAATVVGLTNTSPSMIRLNR